MRVLQGFYGEVYLCKLKFRDGRPPIKCAVKKLINKDVNNEAVYEKNIEEFEREFKLMVSLEHKNIVRMYGECFYSYKGLSAPLSATFIVADL